MTFFDAIALMINEPPWSVKVYRKSDRDVAMIMDFAGSFLLGPISSIKKDDYDRQFKLAKHLIEATNWRIWEKNCHWSKT